MTFSSRNRHKDVVTIFILPSISFHYHSDRWDTAYDIQLNERWWIPFGIFVCLNPIGFEMFCLNPNVGIAIIKNEVQHFGPQNGQHKSRSDWTKTQNRKKRRKKLYAAEYQAHETIRYDSDMYTNGTPMNIPVDASGCQWMW